LLAFASLVVAFVVEDDPLFGVPLINTPPHPPIAQRHLTVWNATGVIQS
jgi:hypothetical protein